MREEDANYQSLAEHRVMYRDYWRVLGNVLTATLGSLYFGYCMAYITSIPLSQIIQYYSSPFSSRTTY
jgi:ABC-type spermidine/putrescine transport system permease subunit I